ETQPFDDIFQRPESSTAEHLKRCGVEQELIDRCFRPFLGAVWLDNNLATSCRSFEFLMRMYREGEAAIPAEGMQQIPQQLATNLEGVEIHTGCKASVIR